MITGYARRLTENDLGRPIKTERDSPSDCELNRNAEPPPPIAPGIFAAVSGSNDWDSVCFAGLHARAAKKTMDHENRDIAIISWLRD
jgi:hypothetical protein